MLFTLTCDQKWSHQSDPKPKTPPITHFVQARTKQDYFVETEDYSISGKQIIQYNVTGLTKDYLFKIRTISPRSIVLRMEIMECSTFNKIGTITSKIIEANKNLSLHYDGTLNLKGISVEGYLYQYGDISMCQYSIGAGINNRTFLEDSSKSLF